MSDGEKADALSAEILPWAAQTNEDTILFLRKLRELNPAASNARLMATVSHLAQSRMSHLQLGVLYAELAYRLMELEDRSNG